MCVIALLWSDVLIDETLLLMLGDTTEYVQGFDEDAFHEIEIGDTLGSVISRLPTPFSIWDTCESRVVYEYTRSFRDSHFRRRMIVFKDGVVVKIAVNAHID